MTSIKNFEVWSCPVFEYDSVESAVESGGAEDGIYRIMLEADSLDILWHGSAFLAGSGERVVLVCFNGAVADRKGKSAPFFSGRGVAQGLRMPLLSIDDPSLSRSDELGLAWYAGHEDMPGLVDLIADYLNQFAEKHRCRLVFFGGSGGGFASISILARMRVEAAALVWNPQTNISKYRSDSVSAYLAAAFPAVAVRQGGDPGTPPSQESLAHALAQAGVAYDVTGWVAPAKVQLLYLQNSSDWHVASHALPFMTAGAWERVGKRAFYSAERGVACWYGTWGEGHAAPPAELINECLSRLIKGSSVRAVAAQLDAEHSALQGSMSWLKVDGKPRTVRVTAKREQDIVKVSTMLEGGVPPDAAYEYAYYLYRDNMRLAVHWYDADPQARIACPAGCGRESVRVFVKDAFGTTVTASVELPEK